MYPVRKTRKIPVVKGQKWPAILLTPQNYSENTRSATRTDNLGDTPSQIAILASLLRDMNTLFPKIFSLITDLDLEDWKMVIVILAILLPLSVQLLIGNVIEPKVMGDTLGLHPVVLLMALVFWGVLWGLPGVLLAAPMTAIAKIVFERIEVTRPLAHVMEGRLETLDEM